MSKSEYDATPDVPSDAMVSALGQLVECLQGRFRAADTRLMLDALSEMPKWAVAEFVSGFVVPFVRRMAEGEASGEFDAGLCTTMDRALRSAKGGSDV